MNMHSFRKYFSLLLLLTVPVLAWLSGCRKMEQYKFSTELAIDSRTVRVAADAKSTRLIVYANGGWTMEPLGQGEWFTLRNSSGDGKGEVLVDLTNNAANLPRAVKLLVKAGSKTDTISLQQRGLTPTINITDVTANSIANGGTIKTPITTNVPLSLMNVTYRYITEGQVDWLSDLKIENGFLFMKVAGNPTAAARSGVLKLEYLDALGTITRDSITINQQLRLDYSNAVNKDLSYIKTALPAGEITEDIYIEGIVISDKGNPNLAKNLNDPANKHALLKTENTLAVYVQSIDGTNGVYIKTKTGGDNIFNFNEHVKIWLKGATLEKYSNPNYVIVKNIESLNIMEKTEGTGILQPREKFMNELIDNDLFTYIKLKSVEFSIPTGAFTNINEGYTARMDCYPASIRDINGSSMYLLMNLDVKYRRDGKQVPQGSGDITGVLVHEEMDRYGGNIGKYSIRPLKREDIALNESRSAGFSNVLVEWNKFRTELSTGATEASNPLSPEIGSGKLWRSGKTALDFTTNGIYASTDYNALIQDPTGAKGSVTNGGWGSKNWWNTTTNKGEYWGIELSTAGITTPISLQLEGNSDPGGPRNFVVEWSESNDDNGVWHTAGTFTFEDVANWTNTLLTQVAGYKAVNIDFPVEASGLNKLVIRVRMANKTVGSATANTGGAYVASAGCRLGYISVKYNK
ncbi:MAG: BACON domain-containing protein [Chitinophagaceae bacterium]|nr:BACON domain-containing protein [Chitinophagaceae bacterium]